MRPSPFVATAVLRHHAELNKQEFPDASKAILSSFYVNDFIGGAATVEEALHLQQSLCKLLSMAGMNLRKWRSSHTEVLNQIPEEIQEKEDRKLMMKEESLKTLGTHWYASWMPYLSQLHSQSLQRMVRSLKGWLPGCIMMFWVL